MATTLDRLRRNLGRVYGLRKDTRLTPVLTVLARSLEHTNLDGDKAVAQVNLRRAWREYLDIWGDYFAIPRLVNEKDQDYSQRIIDEILRLRCTNKAIEATLKRTTGYTAHIIDLWPFQLLSDQFDTPVGHPRQTSDGQLTTPDFGGPSDTACRVGIAYPYLPGHFGVWIVFNAPPPSDLTLDAYILAYPSVLLSDQFTNPVQILGLGVSLFLNAPGAPFDVELVKAVVERNRAAGNKPVYMQL